MRATAASLPQLRSLALNHDRQWSLARKALLDRRIGGRIILYPSSKGRARRNMLIPAQKLPPVRAKSVEKSGSCDPRGDGHGPDRGSELLPLRLLRRPLIGITALALGGVVLWALQKASTGVSFDAMVAALRATSPAALLGSLAATFLSFIALVGYDLSGLRYVGARRLKLCSSPRFAVSRSVTRSASEPFRAVRSATGLFRCRAFRGSNSTRHILYRNRLRHRAGNDRRARSRLAGRRSGGCWARRPYHCGRPRRPF